MNFQDLFLGTVYDQVLSRRTSQAGDPSSSTPENVAIEYDHLLTKAPDQSWPWSQHKHEANFTRNYMWKFHTEGCTPKTRYCR